MICRLCHQDDARVQLRLTPTPIANSFPDHPDTDALRYPLDVQECLHCGHVQLAKMVPIDWVNYRYASPVQLQPHLAEAARVLRGTYPKAKTVLEIGCNNGLYCEELYKVGFSVTGIDPCATDSFIRAPFSYEYARNYLRPVDLIVANNVLAHMEDLWDVFAGIDHLLKDDGALVFEVQYFPDLLARGTFDQIYHEHRDYHTLGPLVPFLKRFGLVISDYREIQTNGGSIRIHCRRPGMGFDLPDESLDWLAFRQRITEAKAVVLAQLMAAPGPIVAFGATAKACTLIHHFGIAGLIDYAMDSTPAKQGRYIPGTAIQILPTHQPSPETTILLTAWNFEKEIRAQYPDHHFIVPFSEEALCPAH